MSFTVWLESHITLHNQESAAEERANALTHLAGAVLSLVAGIWVISRIREIARPSLIIGALIFTVSMLLLYSASSLYHYLPRNNWKRICRILDHSNIYILIAGTYTPLLLYIDTPVCRMLLLLVWGITVFGIVFTLVFWGRLGVIHVLLYLAMGWMMVFFRNDIIPYIPEGLLFWIIAGGLTYTLGVVFYAMKKLPYHHAIWHVFVLGGSMSFFIGFARYLL